MTVEAVKHRTCSRSNFLCRHREAWWRPLTSRGIRRAVWN